MARQWYDALIAQIEETIDVGRIAELAGMVAPPAPSTHPELVEGRPPQVYPRSRSPSGP